MFRILPFIALLLPAVAMGQSVFDSPKFSKPQYDRPQFDTPKFNSPKFDSSTAVPESSSPGPVPRTVIDPVSGQQMQDSGGGFVDPRTGVFYQRVGNGYVETTTGRFIPAQ